MLTGSSKVLTGSSKGFEETVKELLAYDKANHVPPLFEDNNEGYLPSSPLTGARKFVNRIWESHARNHGDVPLDETKKQTETKPKPRTIGAKEIFENEYPPLNFIIPDILPEGLTLLTGKPKAGKSYLMLDWAFTIAYGEKTLDKQCAQGDVLYLALEDFESRLQRRMIETGKCPKDNRLQFAIKWERAKEGGLENIVNHIESNPNIKLIIIDTLVNFRTVPKRQGNVYQEDSEALMPLRDIAHKYHIAIVVIHHLRKQEADDWTETISGSSGLNGIPDSLMQLKKENAKEANAFLLGRGRDFPEFEIPLHCNFEAMTWKVIGIEPQILRTTPQQYEIINILKKYPNGLQLSAIANALSQKPPAVANKLNRLLEENLVEKGEGRGLWRLRVHA